MGTAKRDRQRANRQQRLQELAQQARRTKSKRWGLRVGIGLPIAVGLLFGLAYLTKDHSSTATPASTTIGTSAIAPSTSLDPNASTTSEAATTTDPNATTTTLPAFVFGKGGCPAADGSSVRQAKFSQPFKECIDPSKTYTAEFDTSAGKITVALDTSAVPGTVNNFVTLSRFHYYDGSVFFRADQSIDIIQGGGRTKTDTPGYLIPDEGNGYKYSEGDLVMARSSGPNSGGGQWFFVGGPKASELDATGTYVTFGKVTSGLDVVKSILALGSASSDVPSKTVTVSAVTITES
ncbi:MAG: peptidylprolyl isomerase [Ilumatobacteraceae bacterium]